MKIFFVQHKSSLGTICLKHAKRNFISNFEKKKNELKSDLNIKKKKKKKKKNIGPIRPPHISKWQELQQKCSINP
jgi:hypothetical protein